MIPSIGRPSAAELAAVLREATSAEITADGGRSTHVRGAALAGLREAARVRDRGAAAAWIPLGGVVVELRRHGRALATLEVRGDLSVRLLSWGEAGEAESPEALAKWLAERGVEGPLRGLARRDAMAAALAAWCAAAPPEVRAEVEAIAGDPATARDGARVAALGSALRDARGGTAPAAWALAAWYGARGGAWRDGFSFEAVTAGALRAIGVHEILEAAASGVTEEARAGLARFLVEEVTSRGWAIDRRLPEEVRAALFEAARESGAENEARARPLLLGEGELAPRGSTLVGASQSSRFRRLTTDGVRAFAIDGQDLVELELGRGRAPLTKALKPGSPLAVRDDEVLMEQPSGGVRVRIGDGEVRSGRRPLFDLPARRLPGKLDAYAATRDAALGRVAPGADLLVLEPDVDAVAAYEAFGGDRPAALELRSFWAADVARRVLHEIPKSGGPREVALPGTPVWIGATQNGVLLVVARDDGTTSVIAVDAGGAPRALGEVHAAPDRVRAALLVGDRAWLCLSAPLGDVLVAADPGR